MGFYVVAYGFQSSPWCPKGHYLGRCTVCLGTSAHRPCFDLSICSQPVCPSLFCPSDWLANPIACASFPALPSLFVDSLDSELWYRSGCRACFGFEQHLGRWAVFRLAFHHAECAPRVTSSLTVESLTIRKLQNILGVYIGILAT
jgi:hypothetical protein